LYKIACFDPHESKVRQALFSMLPESFSMEVATVDALEERIRMAKDADFILAGWTPVEKQVLESASKLKLIQKMGIGYDKIDIAKAEEMGIPVAITAGSNAIPVAEHTLLLMLAVYRKLPYVDKSLRQGKWLKNRMRAETRFITGKTVGLIGLGHIAKRLCTLLTGFSVKILYYDIVKPTKEEEHALGVEYCESIEKLLSLSDIVSLHVPLTNATRNLINENNIRAFKQGAILINTSRGEVVSESALYDALVNGPLAGAGLDVFATEPPSVDNPLLKLDNVVVTSHIGGAVMDNLAIVASHSFDNMLRVIQGEPLRAADVVVKGRVLVE
jgi:D-3-phosphoglycerate dehydrogenase